MQSIGKRIASLREDADLTQEDLARILGISRSALSLYEIDKRAPDYQTLRNLADHFHVSVDYILGHPPLDNSQVRENGPNYGTDAEYASKRIVEALESRPELLAVWKELLNRGEMQLLFKQVSGMSDETIRKVISIIKIIEDEEAQETE